MFKYIYNNNKKKHKLINEQMSERKLYIERKRGKLSY